MTCGHTPSQSKNVHGLISECPPPRYRGLARAALWAPLYEHPMYTAVKKKISRKSFFLVEARDKKLYEILLLDKKH